ncbi:tRNA-binding protein [Pararhodobacter aggregans]|uniref:tRNA-binding protein n=1 Tax=Pararhodobacter aggregans TaxID=404875 RepID=A0A2T7UXZ1_9RHOB|nr:tRNA-binding protein [Pararhodobacter aggregans]PTX05128.1 tRNA-binding protein [Pararhodobacter aggregans]PVE49431.1 tRNA-binding protein [Pararhodobacter aggregans]
MIDFADFEKVDIRVGTVVAVDDFPEARKPAWKLTVDFGPEVGVKRSSAQITVHYGKEDLLGRQVMGVVNFPPRQIGKFMSEVLVLGLYDAGGAVVVIGPERAVPNGSRMC